MSSPPPNPTTTTATTTTATTTATADFLKSVARQKPRKHLHPSIYQPFYNPQPQPTTTAAPFPPPTQRQQPPQPSNQRAHHQPPPAAAAGVLYPVASSGRGFLPKHQHPNSDQNLVVGVTPNSDGFPPRHASGYPYAVHRPYGLSNSDAVGQSSHQLVNPSSAHLQQTLIAGVSAAANPKAVGQSPVAADNSLKITRDKNGDDTFVIIRDRKVQVSEGTSLYAQCRSWLKNGSIMEKPETVYAHVLLVHRIFHTLTHNRQTQYVNPVKSLPKPLPASVVEPRNEDDMEIEEKTEDVEHLSAKELLQQHVRHAKKVRARLRNQRLRRIERYKDRLALLLPPVVEQQPKTDTAS